MDEFWTCAFVIKILSCTLIRRTISADDNLPPHLRSVNKYGFLFLFYCSKSDGIDVENKSNEKYTINGLAVM